MNINIYLEDALARQLNQYVKHSGKPRNMVIREALKEWMTFHQSKEWPESILQHKGYPDFPGFELTREELNPPSEDPLS
jgi:metal-responsive CopG/Arc/MetJ family transcriptional regulator